MKKLLIALSVFMVSFFSFVGISLAVGLSADSSAIAVIETTYQGSKIPMNVIAQDLKFPQLIPYFGPTNPGYRFRPLADILLYGNKFTIESAQNNVSDEQLQLHKLIRITDPKILKKVITVIYNDKEKIANVAYGRVGYLTALATNEATSLDAFDIILLLTHKMGSDVVHLTRQGVDFSMFATGWGASIGGVSGGLNANGEGGQVASGMLGWATGKSGANRDPWLQGICLELLP